MQRFTRIALESSPPTSQPGADDQRRGPLHFSAGTTRTIISLTQPTGASTCNRTRLGERCNLDFRADAFNIFNHPDFDVPSNSTSLYSVTRSGNAITKVAVRAPSATFGLLQQTLGSPRILQLSLHLVF
jgi:hypothetical protein